MAVVAELGVLGAMNMEVVDQGEGFWFLLRRDEDIFLDVACNHSFVEYNFLLQLSKAEMADYLTGGREFIHRLALTIQGSAPGVTGSNSPFQSRNVHGNYGREVTAAVLSFRQKGNLL